MRTAKDFCSCRDTKCPRHPTNHEHGCDLCIRKCIHDGEIPSCFFNEVGSAADAPGYTYKDFAEMVLKKN